MYESLPDRRLRATLFYVQYSVCGEKRLLSFQTNQLPFWSTKNVTTLQRVTRPDAEFHALSVDVKTVSKRSEIIV